ncbi:Armadillo repeat-containing protein 3 [Geodia barretti]|uniref:Armadillo repeat-containing protein 3 n=1 Tax=Geodia barretti TaxID=519541 RepID=A0AA35RKP4_GEOBA|nr:Armadillo repeat-containing protein 3 [Geodia barretti]
MAEFGVVSPLVGLLSSPVRATRSYTTLCLSVMTTSADVRRQVCSADGLPALLALLKPDEESVTVEHAAAILSHMAREYFTKTKLLSLSAHQLLLPLMTRDDPNIQRHSLETVCQLVELHQARRAVAEEGGMKSLLSLLSSEFPTIQALALTSLVSCMNDGDCRARLRDADGLSTIVSFLGNKDVSDLHLRAATALSLCLHDAENMTALQTSRSLELLLSLMTDAGANSDMKTCAASALAKAAHDEVNRRILHEQNVEKTFIQLLAHSDGEVVTAGLNGLSAMCGLSSGRARVGQEGGVVGVVSCAGREEGGVRDASAQCLAHISTDSPANCKLIQEADGCVALVRLLTDTQAACRSGAASTITNMAPSPLAREELSAAEVVPALVSCLEFTDVAVQRSAAEALAAMGTDSAGRSQFLASGGVASCLPLLSSASPALLTSALSLLRSMARSLEVAQEFCGNGSVSSVPFILPI